MTEDAATIAEPFGIAQLMSMLAGIFFVVVGAVALARTGVHSLRSPTAEVFSMGMTPLLALIEIGVGVLFMIAAMGRMLARDLDVFLGSLMIAAGLIVLMQPDVLDSWLGMTQTNGIAYLVAGAASVLAAILTPRLMVSRRHVSAM
ncbi:MAG: hypothetical protein ABR548_09860 [Actinomycetota bacterium]|nr:hypothetical protein [Actinomycetota bacterium]